MTACTVAQPLIVRWDCLHGTADGCAGGPQDLRQAVFFVSVGGNDVLDRFLHPLNAAPIPIFVAEMVTGYVRFIEVMWGTPPCGARPVGLIHVLVWALSVTPWPPCGGCSSVKPRPGISPRIQCHTPEASRSLFRATAPCPSWMVGGYCSMPE